MSGPITDADGNVCLFSVLMGKMFANCIATYDVALNRIGWIEPRPMSESPIVQPVHTKLSIRYPDVPIMAHPVPDETWEVIENAVTSQGFIEAGRIPEARVAADAMEDVAHPLVKMFRRQIAEEQRLEDMVAGLAAYQRGRTGLDGEIYRIGSDGRWLPIGNTNLWSIDFRTCEIRCVYRGESSPEFGEICVFCFNDGISKMVIWGRVESVHWTGGFEDVVINAGFWKRMR